MAKFKVGDKVRLKKVLVAGRFYGGVPLSQDMKESAEADGGIHVVKELWKGSCKAYYLDTDYPYVYTEEMLELVEEEEKDLKDFFEALVLMSQLENIMKRLDELMKSNEGE